METNLPATTITSGQPAGFWIRFIATIIDGIIIAAMMIPVSAITGIMTMKSFSPQDPKFLVYTGFSTVIKLVASYLYHALFYQSRGATPGKMVMKLKVVDLATGQNLGFGQTFLREIVGKCVSTMILFIGYIMVGLRSDKKALHDLIANTAVIEIKN